MEYLETDPSNHRWRRILLGLALGVIVAVIVLGYIGFGRIPDAHFSRTDRVYASLELFVLHAPDIPEPLTLRANWELEAARFLAPAGEMLGFVLVFMGLIDGLVDRLCSWWFWARARDHVVICGLGQKGLQLVKDLGSGSRVVVVEKNPSNPHIEECRRLGARVLIGDATEPEVLKKALVHKAKRVVAISGDDGANVEMIIQVDELVSELGKPRNSLECHAHIVDLELRSLFRLHKSFQITPGGLRVSLFNVFENGARMLLQNTFLDYQRPVVSRDDPRQAHLVVLGFGHVGESVVLQAAKTTHFPNGKKLRVSIIDRDATSQYQRFLVRYPAFGDLCEVTPPVDAFAAEPKSFQMIEDWCKEPDSIVTLVICFENDTRSLSVGLSLLARLRDYPAPVFVRVESQAGLARLLSSAGSHPDLNHRIRAFGQVEEACSAEVVTQGKLDEFAQAIHESFRAERTKHQRDAGDFSMVEWRDLNLDLKESNRQQADHIRFKLRAINCASKKQPNATSVSEAADFAVRDITGDELQKLAEIEHNRWVTERALSGWRWGPERNASKRTHPDMEPWDLLSPEVKKYDLDAVALIPKQLAELKSEVIYRLDENGM